MGLDRSGWILLLGLGACSAPARISAPPTLTTPGSGMQVATDPVAFEQPPPAPTMRWVAPTGPTDPPERVVMVPDVGTVRQLYCNGTCSWAGPEGCDQQDADVFCRLLMHRPDARATTFRVTTALPERGYACPQPSYGQSLGPMPEIGIPRDVRFDAGNVLTTHGAGNVVTDVQCEVGGNIVAD